MFSESPNALQFFYFNALFRKVLWGRLMGGIFNILALVAMAVVVAILGWGLWNMFRGGNPQLSQKLMRARVTVQFIAIILLLLAVYFFAPR